MKTTLIGEGKVSITMSIASAQKLLELTGLIGGGGDGEILHIDNLYDTYSPKKLRKTSDKLYDSLSKTLGGIL